MILKATIKAILLSLALSAVACGGSNKEADSPDAVDSDGAMEEAGEEIDDAAEDAGDSMEEAADDVEDEMDDAEDDADM